MQSDGPGDLRAYSKKHERYSVRGVDSKARATLSTKTSQPGEKFVATLADPIAMAIG